MNDQLMKVSTDHAGREEAVAELFAATFTASEGVAEGALIGQFVNELLTTTHPADLRIFLAEQAGALIGAAAFSRLMFENDGRTVFILSPMAVAPDHQGKGVGQALIRHGLTVLRDEGVDIVVTYGDPAYYGKVGFQPLDQETVPPPLPLTHPEGWIGQSLTGGEVPKLAGPAGCVPALRQPSLW